jgi:hypothetical protein
MAHSKERGTVSFRARNGPVLPCIRRQECLPRKRGRPFFSLTLTESSLSLTEINSGIDSADLFNRRLASLLSLSARCFHDHADWK